MKTKREPRPRVSLTLDDELLDVLEEVADWRARTVPQAGRIIFVEALRVVVEAKRSGTLAGLRPEEIRALFAAVERRPRVLDRHGLVAVPSP